MEQRSVWVGVKVWVWIWVPVNMVWTYVWDEWIVFLNMA
jgi:hypothetical protein